MSSLISIAVVVSLLFFFFFNCYFILFFNFYFYFMYVIIKSPYFSYFMPHKTHGNNSAKFQNICISLACSEH